MRRVPVGAGASAEGADTAGVHAMVGGFWLGLSDWGGRAGGARTNGQGLVVSVVFELSEGEGRERERDPGTIQFPPPPWFVLVFRLGWMESWTRLQPNNCWPN